ncbi:MAG: hypothetical protein J0H43_11765, partial [Actinobacteria bacterium]|nr:hypothetical protein [Actinomycetota bacterium]
FALLVTALVLGGMGLLLLLNTASAANELKRHDLAAQDASIAAQVQALQNQVAASAAPGNLAAAAAALGMVPAANPAFLVVEPNGSVRVLGSPAPASGNPVALPAAPASPSPTPHKSTTPSKSASGHSSKSPSRSSSSHPAKPTSTPTQTVVLPGGNR